MQLYYSTSIDNQHIILDEVESRHCVKVLRKNVGEQIYITDGQGHQYETIISEITKRNVICSIEKTLEQPEDPNKYCHIAIAPTKNMERFEWFLEKATEIGIGRITPLLCENSERKNIRLDRLEKIIVSAMKQSLKFYKPLLDDLVQFNNFIEQNSGVNKFIAHCEEGKTSSLFEAYEKQSNCVVLIGPEGDFSKTEINKAIEKGFIGVSLGESRLRTETAGFVACQLVVTKNTLTGNLPG